MTRCKTVALMIAASLFCVAGLMAEERDQIAARGPLRLSLRRAVELATSPEGSTRIQIQLESVKQAKARIAQARATLLPDIESYVAITSSVRSLSAQGLTSINIALPPGLADLIGLQNGISIPERAGPFHDLDVRGQAQQSIFDFPSYRRLQSSNAQMRSTKQSVNDIDDQVTAQVSKSYLTALRTDADLEAVQADVELSDAVVKQSQNQRTAGSGTGMDVTRANVQLANDKQRFLVARNNQTKAHLQLLRVMNLRMDTQVELTDKLAYKPLDTLTVQDAVAQALANRSDLKAQLDHEDAVKLNASAVKFERLPTVVAQFDYGVIGPQDVHLVPTRDYYGVMRIPIFDGGRRDARRAEAFSQLRQEQVRSSDLRDQIELDVRVAMDSLKSADEQVQVAKSGLKLAENELAQARRRYAAGVSGSLEVSDASDKLERARGNQIQALYSHNMARIDLGQALGKTVSMLD